MALKAPTPPTPPAPPIPPKVELMEGGSVKETTVPQSHGPRTEEEIHEAQAREAVANGEGPLSKTTVTDGKKESPEPNAREVTAPVSEKGMAEPRIPAGGSKTDRTALQQDAQAQMLMGEENTAGSSQALQATPPKLPESPEYHGMFYWGSTLLAITVLVAMVLRKILFREKEKGTAREPTPQELEVKLRAGMTAAEALEEIRQQEAKPPMMPPLQVAKEYAARAAAPSPRAKKPSSQDFQRPSGKKDGEERFEVRV